MAELSVLVDLVRKMQGAQRQPGKPGARGSARAPAMPGFTRGALGSLGANTYQARDSAAGSNKEREMLQSPIMKAYLRRLNPQTPVTDYLARGT